MMATIADLKRVLDARVDDAYRETFVEVARRVVERTPKRTGHTVANWRLGVGTPDGRVDDTRDPTGSVTMRRLRREARSLTVDRGNAFLTNSLPHAPRLEFGASDLEPAGMVRVTLAEGPMIERRAAQKVRRGQ